MTTQIACAYKATAAGGFTPGQLQTAMAAVPVDNDLLLAYGLRVLSDSTGVSSNTVTRTITLAMVPSFNGSATAVLFGGDQTGGPIASVGFVAGADYVVPPVVTAGSPGVNGRTAQMHATLGVVTATVVGGGSGYTGATVLVFSGGNLASGGTQATATPTIVAGVITGVTMVSNGGPYNIPPTLTAVDSGGGSGATFATHLGISSVVLDDPGNGYTAANDALTVTPYYKAIFPDGTDQGSPVANWMTEVFENALNVPVVALTPVVS